VRGYTLDARLLEASKQLVTACKLTVTARGMLDPKVLAYLLLCRTISNFEGMLLVEKHGLFARATSEIFDGLEPGMQGAVVDFLDRAAKSNLLSPKSASGAGAFKTAYLAYSQFSGDAAHPSLTALARHWRRAEDRTVEVVVRREVSQAELDQTLIFAGMAVLGLLGIIDEMFGHVAPSGTLVRLRDELQALQDEEAAVVAATPADAAR
jgi:hypothetical protein